LRGRNSGSKYPKDPQTLGEHLRKVRLDRGLLQKDVARELSVKKGTVAAWEVNRNPVAVQLIPRVLAFLGYDPRAEGRSMGEKIRARREELGLSRRALALKIGVSRSTVRAWERGGGKRLFAETLKRFRNLLEEAES
jgi:transcriptional regulator with XRE-family HTH domain